MLLLYETSAGYALFKVSDPGKLNEVDNLWREFEQDGLAGAKKIVKLKAFSPFSDTTEAVAATAALVDSKMNKSLSKFLKKHIIKKQLSDELAVADAKLGSIIKDKLEIQCVNNSSIMELFRCVRSQFEDLVADSGFGVEASDLKAMRLGLSHSLSRYKLKFTADKVDVMIVQAIGLLDDLDKEINTYAMRVKEWYGWHFPELAKLLNDNVQYTKTVLRMGMRINAKTSDFSDILEDEALETRLKETAEISMGTEISDVDLLNIQSLAEQVTALSEYRAQLYEYLKNRMAAIAPNLTVMVGELVGARLIAHAGSLLNLAKYPASTIQILGAEKALFRALKTKHDTPKYGLIYHASLIGQAQPKFKGKISRVLAAKTALSARVDAMGESEGPTIALECRVKVESRLRQLEGGVAPTVKKVSAPSGPKSYSAEDARALAPPRYNDASDVTVHAEKKKKRISEPAEAAEEAEAQPENGSEPVKKKKKKKPVEDDGVQEAEAEPVKKKKKKPADEVEPEHQTNGDADGDDRPKKKKKKKNIEATEEN